MSAVGLRDRCSLCGRGPTLRSATVVYSFAALYLAVCQIRPKSFLGLARHRSVHFGSNPVSSIRNHLCRFTDLHRRSHPGVVRKRLDVGVLFSVGLGSLTALATYPPMLHAQALLLSTIRNSPIFWGRPGWADLGCYEKMLPMFVPSLLPFVALAWVVIYGCVPRTRMVSERPFCAQPEDLAVADVLTMFVPIMLLLTHFGTNYFVPRYAIGSALGAALLAGILAAYAGARWRIVKGLVPLIVIYCVTVGLVTSWRSATPKPPLDYGESLFAAVPGAEPIVVASSLDFMPSWWYADGPTRHRLHYLSDLQSAKSTPDLIPEYSLYLIRHQTPMQMENYSSFLKTHKTFLVYSVGSPGLEWLQPRLVREGWELKLIASDARGKLFRATAPF